MSIDGVTSTILGVYNPNKKSSPIPHWGDTSRSQKSIPKPNQILIKDSDGKWKPTDQIPEFERPGTIVGKYITNGSFASTVTSDTDNANLIITFPVETLEASIVHDVLRILYSLKQSHSSRETIYPELFNHISVNSTEPGFKLTEFDSDKFIGKDSLHVLLITMKRRIEKINIKGMNSFIPQIRGMLERIEK